MSLPFELAAFINRLASDAGLKLSLALVHFLWQGVLVAALAAVMMRLIGRRSPQRRYLIGVIGMLAMAIAPLVTFCLVEPPHWPEPIVASVPVVELSSQEIAQFEALLATYDEESVPIRDPIAPVRPLTWPERIRLWQPYALLLWLCGTAVCALRLGIGVQASWRFGRKRRPLPDQWREVAARVAKRLGIAAPRVFVSDRIVEAVAVGLLRPMVLLPAAWVGQVPLDVLEAVLAHEIAHVRRYDLWANLLQRGVEAALFYHPAVWWLSRRIRIEREYCCDEMAATVVSGRAAYARALEYVAKERVASTRRPVWSAAMAAGMGGSHMALLDRVRRVLGSDVKPTRSTWLSEGLLALAVPAALWAGIVTIAPSAATAEDQANSVVEDSSVSEELHVGDEDVAVILRELRDEMQKLRREMNEVRRQSVERKVREALEHSPQNQRTDEALERSLSINLHDVPFDEALQKIRPDALNVVIDQAGLDEEGVLLTTPVSLELSTVPVRVALQKLLTPLNLAYTVEDGVVTITSRLRSQGELNVQTYPVADLVVPEGNPIGNWRTQTGEAPKEVSDNLKTLTELITGTIEPGSWENVGGNAVLRVNETTVSLVIRQTRPVHEQIADLLDTLRKLQRTDVIHPEAAYLLDRATKLADRDSVNLNHPAAALEKRVSVDFFSVPLNQALAQLRREADVNFDIYEISLRQQGVSPQTPVTLKLKNVPLGIVLQSMLSPLRLGIRVDERGIIITNDSDAKGPLETRSYRIADLVEPPQYPSANEKSKDSHDSFESLQQLITRTIEPASWSRVGGKGSIDADEASLSLQIRQTVDVHNQIRALIEQLRELHSRTVRPINRTHRQAHVGFGPIKAREATAAAPTPPTRPPEPVGSESSSAPLKPPVAPHAPISNVEQSIRVVPLMVDGKRIEVIVEEIREGAGPARQIELRILKDPEPGTKVYSDPAAVEAATKAEEEQQPATERVDQATREVYERVERQHRQALAQQASRDAAEAVEKTRELLQGTRRVVASDHPKIKEAEAELREAEQRAERQRLLAAMLEAHPEMPVERVEREVDAVLERKSVLQSERTDRDFRRHAAEAEQRAKALQQKLDEQTKTIEHLQKKLGEASLPHASDEALRPLIDEYNGLIQREEFAKALEVAKRAREQFPHDPATIPLLYKAKTLLDQNAKDQARTRDAFDEKNADEAGSSRTEEEHGVNPPPAAKGTTQVRFVAPAGMMVHHGGKDGQKLDGVAPARLNLQQGTSHELQFKSVPDHPDLTILANVEVAKSASQSQVFLAHNSVPLEITSEDLDQLESHNQVTKVIYLPDSQDNGRPFSGLETLVSTRLDPGVDPVAEAQRRGTVLAVLRMSAEIRSAWLPFNLSAPYDGQSKQFWFHVGFVR